MIYWILKNIIISLIIIYLFHELINYIKNVFTKPICVDLFEKVKSKKDHLNKCLKRENNKVENNCIKEEESDNILSNELMKINMKEELKMFIKSKKDENIYKDNKT
jgi:ERCC4-related helicase